MQTDSASSTSLVERLAADIEANGRDKVYCGVWRQVSPGVYALVDYVDEKSVARRVRRDMSEMLDAMPAWKLLKLLKSQLEDKAQQPQAEEEAAEALPLWSQINEFLASGRQGDLLEELLADAVPAAAPAPAKRARKTKSAKSAPKRAKKLQKNLPNPDSAAFALERETYIGAWPAGRA